MVDVMMSRARSVKSLVQIEVVGLEIWLARWRLRRGSTAESTPHSWHASSHHAAKAAGASKLGGNLVDQLHHFWIALVLEDVAGIRRNVLECGRHLGVLQGKTKKPRPKCVKVIPSDQFESYIVDW